MTQHLSENGIDLITKFEGCKLQAYLDSGGVPTIGIGHTKGVKMGDAIAYIQARDFLRTDIAIAEAAINADNLSLTQEQFDAVVILVFNIGTGEKGYAGSTIRKMLKEKRYIDAAAQFSRWYFDNGIPNKGLLSRRLKEALYFLKSFP